MIEFPSIVTVGASYKISSDEMVMVTISLAFARVLVELFETMFTETSGTVLSMVTVDPSVVVFKTAEPRFSFTS